jgi:ribonuclease HI
MNSISVQENGPAEGDFMERLYCDASYFKGWGGMSVVGPLWSSKCCGDWHRKWNVQTVKDAAPEGEMSVFYAGCGCSSNNHAELRALGMAFLLAYDIMAVTDGERVEIVSDSLLMLDWITNPSPDRDLAMVLMSPLRRLWRWDRRVILSKVRGHRGNVYNELADKWAKHARLKTEPKKGFSQLGRFLLF